MADNIIDTIDNNFLEELDKLQLPPGPADPLNHVEARRWVERFYRHLPKAPSTIQRVRAPSEVNVHNVLVTYGHEASFNLRVYQTQTPSNEQKQKALPAVLAYHGGGWIHGHSELEDEMYQFMASETRSVVFGVDYRLAPEHKFPVPHDDCYEALNHVVANADKYGIDLQRIALWGASAGGNLAAGVALRDAQEHGPTRICHLNLACPALCPPSLAPNILSVPSASYPHFTSQENSLALTRVENLWELYANGRDNLSDPYVSPLLGTPTIDHCPMYLVAAGADVLRDEGIAYGLKYRNVGCDVQLEIIPGAPHNMLAASEACVFRQYWRNQIRVLNVVFHTEF